MLLSGRGSDLQDAGILSIGVSFAVVVVWVDLVGNGDFQVIVALWSVLDFIFFIAGGGVWFATKKFFQLIFMNI